jgi:23S rRNA pseudouridine955/2504/2580 synthase
MAHLITVSTADNTQRLERWFKKHYPHIPYTVMQKWLRTGQMRLNGKRIKGQVELSTGDVVRMPPHLDVSPVLKSHGLPQQKNKKTLALLRNNIIYENQDLVILNKPAGLPTQGGTNLKESLTLYLDDLLGGQEQGLRVVHRLDKDTAGLLILAKSLESARYLTALFRDHQIQKTYLAVAVGRLPQKSGVINAPIGKLQGAQKEKMSTKAPDGDEAITDYTVLGYDSQQNLSLVQLSPQTGRTHQLRVHLAEALGCPILGDGKYGGKFAHPLVQRTQLHLAATGLSFKLPGGKPLTLSIPCPDFFVITTQGLSGQKEGAKRHKTKPSSRKS